MKRDPTQWYWVLLAFLAVLAVAAALYLALPVPEAPLETDAVETPTERSDSAAARADSLRQ